MLENGRMCNADVLEDKMAKNKHLQKMDYILSLHHSEGVAYGRDPNLKRARYFLNSPKTCLPRGKIDKKSIWMQNTEVSLSLIHC